MWGMIFKNFAQLLLFTNSIRHYERWKINSVIVEGNTSIGLNTEEVKYKYVIYSDISFYFPMHEPLVRYKSPNLQVHLIFLLMDSTKDAAQGRVEWIFVSV